MNAYETERAAKIARNQALLRNLGLNEKAQHLKVTAQTPGQSRSKKRKLGTLEDRAPIRTSARLAAVPVKPVYNDDELELAERRLTKSKIPKTLAKKSRSIKPEEAEQLGSSQKIGKLPEEEIERIKAGWSAWESKGQTPVASEDGSLIFENYPDFRPNKTPEQIIREGCFGGSYFRPLFSRVLGITIRDDYKELPRAWLEGLNVEKYLTSEEYDPEVNKYQVACGQSIEEWEASGWIRHEYDIRGWFQWYCRFYLGRRCDDDERQISRWKKCVGDTGRWRRILLKKYVTMGIRTVTDEGNEDGEEEIREVSPVVHQTCHHWAWEVRQEALDRFWSTGK